MSVTSNAIVSIAKIVEDHLRRHTYLRKGKKLNKPQNRIYADALVLLALAWYDLIPSVGLHQPRWLVPWLQEIASTDVVVLVDTLKLAGEFLVVYGSSFFNYDTFKQYLRAGGGKVSLIAPTKSLVDEWALYRDPLSLRRLRTLYLFITRLNLPGLKDLEREAAVRYVAVDDSLPSDFLMREQEVITSWFPYTSLGTLCEYWHPCHGPGSTADAGDDKLLKYQSFGSDDMIRRLDLLLGGNTAPHFDGQLDREAKVVFVPKSIDKLRTICMEPSTLMWYQQGFALAINTYIKNHKYLRRRINLENQLESQELAYLASIDGKLATIDLSDASDSVSWSLVKSWMQHSSLLPICWMTRSRRAQVAGVGSMVPKKFAPMGSAMCFPIECIVFAAIVEASILALGGSPHNSDYRVYGDDIIVETKYVYEVIRRLTENGFKVNTSKSFYRRETHNFRESCGGDYFDGVDVRPLRLSRKFSGLTQGSALSASRIAALIDLCNDAFSVVPSVRRYVIWDLLKLPRHCRPVFDHTGEFGIFSPTPSNFHLPTPVYHQDYQQWYIKHGGLRDSGNRSRGEVGLALYEHLRLISNRKHLSIASDRVFVALSRKPRLEWCVMNTALEQVTSQVTQEDLEKAD